MSEHPAPLDTSVLIALESGRCLDVDSLPEHMAVSIVSFGELHAALPITVEVVHWSAEMRVSLAE